jgi:hypothetical protein
VSKEIDIKDLEFTSRALNSPSYNQQLLSYSGRHESKEKLSELLDRVIANYATRHEDPIKNISRSELRVAAANCKFSLETPSTHRTPEVTPLSTRDITPNSSPNASRSPSPSSNNRRSGNGGFSSGGGLGSGDSTSSAATGNNTNARLIIDLFFAGLIVIIFVSISYLYFSNLIVPFAVTPNFCL